MKQKIKKNMESVKVAMEGTRCNRYPSAPEKTLSRSLNNFEQHAEHRDALYLYGQFDTYSKL